MEYHENILGTIGNTPLVKLNKITSEIPGLVLAKIEFFNPGNSIKDRMALKMIEDAESSGKLKKGGTIVEGTSGNTGMGLAIAARVKGYQLICVTTDKQSKEKIDALKAVGAKVIICPTNVDPEDENFIIPQLRGFQMKLQMLGMRINTITFQTLMHISKKQAPKYGNRQREKLLICRWSWHWRNDIRRS